MTGNIRLLLEKDFYHDEYFEGDDPLVFWALQSGELDLIELLIENKVPLALREDGQTLLQVAAAEGCGEIVEFYYKEVLMLTQKRMMAVHR